jgi:transposase-like protein
MSRISIEVIIAAVKRCVSGESSYTEEMKLLGVPKQTLQDWIRKYETFGIEGFLPSGNEKYSKGTKERAVNAYLNGEGSQAYICRKFKIKDRKTLRTWIKVYNSHRELRPSRGRGSDIYMTKGRNTTYEERVEIVSYCIEHGNDYVATIEKYGVSYQQIYSWVRKYNEKGAEGLVDKRGKRKLESEMTELEKLRAENRMLEAQNRRLELECAVLKKLEEIERRWR